MLGEGREISLINLGSRHSGYCLATEIVHEVGAQGPHREHALRLDLYIGCQAAASPRTIHAVIHHSLQG